MALEYGKTKYRKRIKEKRKERFYKLINKFYWAKLHWTEANSRLSHSFSCFTGTLSVYRYSAWDLLQIRGGSSGIGDTCGGRTSLIQWSLNSWTSVRLVIRARSCKDSRRLTAVRAREFEGRGHLTWVHNGGRREEEAGLDCKEETVSSFFFFFLNLHQEHLKADKQRQSKHTNKQKQAHVTETTG